MIDYSLNISEIHERYVSGALTPAALCADIKTSIEAYKEYNIWIHVLNDEELQVYLSQLKGKTPDDLPLYGIPFAIKDNIDLAGAPTTAACKEYSYIPDKSAFAVQLLIEAGAIPIGKTNLDQFATGLVGTRSPYGVVKNSFNPDYISGGSSSGSAVAVALGQVSFSLGTDTAGSGRVPAAFNNLIGFKPSKGLISTSGVVPACRSLDCVSIFALNPDDAHTVFDILNKHDEIDIYSRKYKKEKINGYRIGVPDETTLAFFGNKEYERLFRENIAGLADKGYETVIVDFTPFIEAAKLLYQGPWIAERYAAIESFIEKQPEALHPVTREIISPARKIDSVDTFKSIYRLQQLKKQADEIMQSVDFIMTPTTGTKYTIEDINKEPVKYNSNLGFYTNFMNLLDYTAIALPAGFDKDSFPFGITLFSQVFTDADLLFHSRNVLGLKLEKTGSIDFNWLCKESMAERKEEDFIDIAVCGAHQSGMPLNHQLTDRNASLLKKTKTKPVYRLYALAGGPPYRPGLIKDDANGVAIEVEVWRMPLSNFGSFMLGIPHPLGIGRIVLEDGDEVNGFICEAYAISDAEDISHFGSWRNYIKNLSDNS